MKDGNPEPLVLREDQDRVARLTLNSASNYNALSTAMIDALSDALDEVAADPSIRVLVLAARGKAFCAGHDLREIQAPAMTRTTAAPPMSGCSRIARR